MNLSDAILPADVFLGLSAASKAELIQKLAAHAAHRLNLDGAMILDALEVRERLGSTGIGQGVAIPHAIIDGLKEPYGLLAVLNKALDFESVDEIPIDVVFLLLAPPGKSGEQLTILSSIARKARTGPLLDRLRTTTSPETVQAILTEEPL
ncbi:MAG: PTS sugar transporter subunit IIA [Rhodospirillaceae bacterium]|nr:PTS sugar transporter subunit IIA [Rhodospirillaceae bacterium]